MFRQEALERLSTPERLDELMHVTSPRSWIVLVALGGLLVAALIWSTFTVLSTTVTGPGVLAGANLSGHGREAIVFVKPADSVAIRPGMDVALTQASARSGTVRTLDGTVTSVDEYPASRSRMLRTLKSAGLVQLLMSAGQVVPVHVRLSTVSQQVGSSTSRAGQQLDPIRATITTSRQRIIRMIIP